MVNPVDLFYRLAQAKAIAPAISGAFGLAFKCRIIRYLKAETFITHDLWEIPCLP
jgi:hypothetical protein